MDSDGAFKCPRCWIRHRQDDNFGFTEEQIAEANDLKECAPYHRLCDRCMEVVINDHPTHWSVPYIEVCIIKKYDRVNNNRNR